MTNDEVYDNCVYNEDVWEPIGTYEKRRTHYIKPKNSKVNKDMQTPDPGWWVAKQIQDRQAQTVDRRKNQATKRKRVQTYTWKRPS